MIAILLLIWNSWYRMFAGEYLTKRGGEGGQKKTLYRNELYILYVGSWCTYNTPSTLEWNWIYSHSIKMIILSECLFHWVVSPAMMNEKEGETRLGCFWFLLLWRITSMWYVAELWWISLCVGKITANSTAFFASQRKQQPMGWWCLSKMPPVTLELRGGLKRHLTSHNPWDNLIIIPARSTCN
jgi:hypothetical protein